MINMKKLLTLISLITVTLMLLCACGGSVDTSSDGTSNTETDSGIGNTDSDTTGSGAGSTDSDTGNGGSGITDSDTGGSDAPTGDLDTTDSGTGEAPPSGDGSGDLVDDPNVDDWWTDNKQ